MSKILLKLINDSAAIFGMQLVKAVELKRTDLLYISVK